MRRSAVRVRPLVEDDFGIAIPFMNEAAPGHELDEAELRLWFDNPARDVEFALVEDGSGTLVAYVDVSLPAEQPDKAWLDLRIPARTLADDSFDAAMAWAEEAARARGRTLVRAQVEAADLLAARLAARGYEPIRFSFQMQIDLGGAPAEPAWPTGIAVAAMAGGEERAVYEAVTEAFEDHWEFFRNPFDEWAHFMIEPGDFDRGLFFVARDGDEIAGVSLCRPSRPGCPGVGWVRQLGVRRPWRRRGLALALLLHSFGEFWRRGTRAVGLGVDGESQTGAVRLYEKAGMRVERRFDIFEGRLS
jgi:ribosomal protein S18 acetylase RimI-like enzyme